MAVRRGPGWTAWAFIVALLVLGAWMLSSRWGRTPAAAPPPFPPPAQTNTLYESRIRDVSGIMNAPDKSRLSGTRVQLANLRVESVMGRAFTVAGGLMVVPLNDQTPMDAVRPGALLSVSGSLEKPASAEEIQREWKLDPATADRLAAQEIYLRAGSIAAGHVNGF